MSMITFAGNLADDPELAFTPSGKAVCKFRVLENRGKQTPGGWKDEEPNGYNVQVWEGLAQNIADSLRRGDRVVVVGTIVTERWTDRDSQESRTKQFVRAREVGASLRFHVVTAMGRGSSSGQTN